MPNLGGQFPGNGVSQSLDTNNFRQQPARMPGAPPMMPAMNPVPSLQGLNKDSIQMRPSYPQQQR